MVQGQLSPHVLHLGEGNLPEGDDEQNGDHERSCSPRGLPHPRLEFADPKAPGFRPGIPRTSLNGQTPVPWEAAQRCWGAAWAPGEAAPSVPAPSPRQAALCFPAAPDFCGVMVTWRFRHGVFQAPRQGPETPPLWASLWVAGCQPKPEPLIPAGPTACQAAQLGVAEPPASTAPGPQLLCSAFSGVSAGTDSWGPLTPVQCSPSDFSCHQKPCGQILSLHSITSQGGRVCLEPPSLFWPRPASINKHRFIGLALLLLEGQEPEPGRNGSLPSAAEPFQ